MFNMSKANISLDRVQRVLWSQLERFQTSYDENPIVESQDLRALSIAWIAVFLEEAVPPSFLETLMEVVLRLRARADFSHRGWHCLAPMDVALFALTGDRDWLFYVATNLDHHSSVLRRFVVNSFALIANRRFPPAARALAYSLPIATLAASGSALVWSASAWRIR